MRLSAFGVGMRMNTRNRQLNSVLQPTRIKPLHFRLHRFDEFCVMPLVAIRRQESSWFMLNTKWLIPSLAILSSLLAVNPKRAFACSCMVSGPPAEEIESSTAVFAGMVTNLDIPNKGPIYSSADPVKITFQVTRVWKGPEHSTLIVNTVRSAVSCEYEFQTGQEYLVYTRGTEDNLQTSLCSRTQLLSVAGEDLKALGEGKVPVAENPNLSTDR